MSSIPAINAEEFVAKVRPALEAQDWDGLITVLKANWTPDQITSLLGHPACDARKTGALALSLIGQSCCLPELSAKLWDDDRMVAEMAEHAMWSIWFRGGSEEANAHLARGAEALNKQNVQRAIVHLDRAVKLCPDFPEAYNQRAIAYYLSEHYAESIADCQKVVAMMPLHFGAWSGMGHCYLALGEIALARDAYEHALKVNPHLECIAELVHEMRTAD